MNRSSKESWFDSLVEYSPILALFMLFVTIAAKAVKVGNPSIWLVGLTALPSLVAILWAGRIVYRRGRNG
jgi:hypothetical protein